MPANEVLAMNAMNTEEVFAPDYLKMSDGYN